MAAQPENFLLVWRKLPDELKLQVLRHALPSGLILRSEVFDANNQGVDYGFAYPYFQRDILPFLACPEISEMATEVLYTQNVSSFVVTDRHPNKLTPLPPTPARKFIRTWKAILNIEDVYTSRFRLLAECLRKFPKTEKATLVIGGEPETKDRSGWRYVDILADIRQRVLDMDKIEFDTDRLEIVHKVDGVRCLFEDFTCVFQEKLVIVDNGKHVEQEIERLLTTIAVSSVRSRMNTDAQTWPAVLYSGRHIRHSRIIKWR